MGFPDLTQFVADREVVVIIDKNVDHTWGKFFPYKKIVIDSCEENKNLATVEDILNQLLELNASRDCLLIGIGGGIVTDITGFVASIYKRGVKYGLVPTSLLAQIDASVGGKTGVNLSGVKNAVGTFSTPEFVVIFPLVLHTLPKDEYRNGVYELLKIFIIKDKAQYQQSLYYSSNDLGVNYDQILKAIEYKCQIVESDFKEIAQRRVLNLGHTFGHALETYSKFKLSHGEAVAIGIIIAARIGVKLGITPEYLPDQFLRDFTSMGLQMPKLPPYSKLIKNIKNDKKRSGENIYFVVPTSIGSVQMVSLSLQQLSELF